MKTSYTQNYNTFSGEIDIEDFSTSTPNKKRINKYVEADNLEKTIFEKEQVKKKMNIYKSMTLEEKIGQLFINMGASRDEEYLKGVLDNYQKPGTWNTEKYGEYSGATNWQEYCSFINDVLRNIRAGQIDYVYYIYHILDLLKFHYEDLKTRYRDGYWEVWLDK